MELTRQEKLNLLQQRFKCTDTEKIIDACISAIYFETGDKKGLTKEANWMHEFLTDFMNLHLGK